MRPTRRGYAVIGVVGLTIASAAVFGARGLNAIAAPAVVALVYGAVQVYRLDVPRVTRDLPSRGEQGSTVTVELEVEVDRPHAARVVDAVGNGLRAKGNDRDVSLGSGPLMYELYLRRRGDRTVGPVSIESRDVLGLLARTTEVRETDTILVRPQIYALSGTRADELVWLFGGGDDRREFDFLRHYRRGDPLRDIHWRSSAKVPTEDFVVKEFSTDEGVSSVWVAGECDDRYADEMAAAMASIATHFLSAGLRVGVVTADAEVQAHGGTEHREAVLDALARTGGGTLVTDDRGDADVVVVADETGVRVELADGVAPFSQVAGHEVSVPPREGPERWLTERIGRVA